MCDGNTLFKKKLRVDLMDSPKRQKKKKTTIHLFFGKEGDVFDFDV